MAYKALSDLVLAHLHSLNFWWLSPSLSSLQTRWWTLSFLHMSFSLLFTGLRSCLQSSPFHIAKSYSTFTSQFNHDLFWVGVPDFPVKARLCLNSAVNRFPLPLLTSILQRDCLYSHTQEIQVPKPCLLLASPTHSTIILMWLYWYLI